MSGMLLKALALAFVVVFARPAFSEPNSGSAEHFGTLEARAWTSDHVSGAPRLVIVLHGDLADSRYDYQYRFAQHASTQLSDSVVVALLRPGYGDSYGARSEGDRGFATGDNYEPAVIDALSESIRAAKRRYNARSVTIVGHSGGAALAADVAEADPNLASRLLLVSCPCDVPAWRSHMAARTYNPIWLLPVHSISPLEGVKQLGAGAQVSLVVGEGDPVAPAQLTSQFAEAARAAGAKTHVLLLPNAGHEILLDARVLAELVSLQVDP